METDTPRKRGRPAQEAIAPGKRGRMKDGIRQYVSSDSKTVRYQVKVSASDPSTGKVRATWNTFTTKADAERARDSQRHDRGAGRFVFAEKLTVEQWITSFLAARSAGLKASTIESYEDKAKHVTTHLGGLKLQDLNAERIQGFERTLSATLGPGTVRGVMRFLKSALGLAVARGKLKANPFGSREAPAVILPRKAEGETVHALSADDLNSLLRVFSVSALWLSVALLAYTGLRRGEMCALRWKSIDFNAETLHVGGTVQSLKTGLKIDSPKAARSRRTIPIDGDLLAALRQLKAEQARAGLALGLAQTDSWLVFPVAPNQPEMPMRPQAWAQRFTAVVKPTRFAQITPHDLRHAHGSILLAEGVGLPTVAGRLGHSPAVCASTYAHEIAGQERVAAVKFARSVAGSGSGLPGAPNSAPEEVSNLLIRQAG